MHKFWVCAYKSQDFAQGQENFARSNYRETVTFRNSAGDMQGGTGVLQGYTGVLPGSYRSVTEVVHWCDSPGLSYIQLAGYFSPTRIRLRS